jgi:hypothetical protein
MLFDRSAWPLPRNSAVEVVDRDFDAARGEDDVAAVLSGRLTMLIAHVEWTSSSAGLSNGWCRNPTSA